MIIFIIFSSQKTRGRAASLLRRSCTKKRALNYVENVKKDQNCDRLNFIFVHFSLENKDVYCI